MAHLTEKNIPYFARPPSCILLSLLCPQRELFRALQVHGFLSEEERTLTVFLEMGKAMRTRV